MAALLVGLNRSWSGDREGATDYFGEVLDGGDPDEVITVYALAETALTQLERGDVELALANAETASRRASDAWLDDIFVIALARGAAALCQIAVGDKEAARTHLEAAAASIDALELALPVDAMRTRLLLAEAAIELGLFDLAEHHLDGAEASGAKVPDAGVLDLQLPELRARLQQTMLANNPPSLSARELEVLSLLPTDLSVQEIAHDLFVSRETVRSHLRRIYRELAVGKRSEAVVEARRRGLLPDQQA